MFFYVLFGMVTLGLASSFHFDNAIIDIEPVSSNAVPTYGGIADTCHTLMVGRQQLYHISTLNVYQAAMKGNLKYPTTQINVTTSFEVTSFAYTIQEIVIMFVTTEATNNLLQKILNSTSFQIKFQGTISAQGTPLAILRFGSNIITLTVDTITNMTYLRITDKVTTLVTTQVPCSSNYKRMVDNNRKQSIIAVWTQLSQVTIFNANLVNKSYWVPTVTPAPNSTNNIVFSNDTSFFIIQTDHFNPISILSASTFETVYQVSVEDIIHQVHFIDNSNNLIGVVCQNSYRVIDLTVNSQYLMPAIQATSYTSDQQGNFFTCRNNQIQQKSLTFTKTSNQIKQNQFYRPINITDPHADVFAIVDSSLNITIRTIGFIENFMDCIPLTFIFLGFINYFTMSSLYVLLNIQIPEQVYRVLALLYNEINSSILSLFGIDLEVPILTSQRVTSRRGIFFGVSSDIISSNLSAFIFLILNIAFILGIQLLTSFCRKNNFLRKLFKQNKWQMAYFQVTNILVPLLLPWTFIMIESGVRDFKDKMNSIAYLIIFFMGFVFPLYYLFDLLQDRQKQLIDKRRKNELQAIRKQKQQNVKMILREKKKQKQEQEQLKNLKSQSVQVKENQRERVRMKAKTVPKKKVTKVKFDENSKQKVSQTQQQKKAKTISKFKPTCLKNPSIINCVKPNSVPPKRKQITLSQLLTAEIIEQWYLCQANFLIPSLVLLSDPIFFLVAILLYSAMGIAISFRKKQRLNSLILSTYPFLFHLFFIVFYAKPPSDVTLVTELLCLGVLLIGSIHHSISLLYEVIVTIAKLIRQACKSNKVDPQVPTTLKKNKARTMTKLKEISNNIMEYIKKKEPQESKEVNRSENTEKRVEQKTMSSRRRNTRRRAKQDLSLRQVPKLQVLSKDP